MDKERKTQWYVKDHYGTNLGPDGQYYRKLGSRFGFVSSKDALLEVKLLREIDSGAVSPRVLFDSCDQCGVKLVPASFFHMPSSRQKHPADRFDSVSSAAAWQEWQTQVRTKKT